MLAFHQQQQQQSTSCVENWLVTDTDAGYQIMNTEDEVDKGHGIGDREEGVEKKEKKVEKLRWVGCV